MVKLDLLKLTSSLLQLSLLVSVETNSNDHQRELVAKVQCRNRVNGSVLRSHTVRYVSPTTVAQVTLEHVPYSTSSQHGHHKILVQERWKNECGEKTHVMERSPFLDSVKNWRRASSRIFQNQAQGVRLSNW